MPFSSKRPARTNSKAPAAPAAPKREGADASKHRVLSAVARLHKAGMLRFKSDEPKGPDSE